MKKRVGILLTIALVLLCAVALADVPINEYNFPDAAFRKAVQKFDLNENGSLNMNEIALAKTLHISGKGISSLKGIEYLTNLRILEANYNKLTAVDLKKNLELKEIYLDTNQIKKLNLTKNKALTVVNISNNGLKTLTLGKHPTLKQLDAGLNKLTGISLKDCPALLELNLSNNQLSGISLAQNTLLMKLYVNDNYLDKLDVSPCRDLYVLACQSNDFLTLDVSQNDDLATIVKLRKPTHYKGVSTYTDSTKSDGTFLSVDQGATIITTTQNIVDVAGGKYELNHKKLTAVFLAPSNKKAENVYIDNTLKYYNKVYKIVEIAASAFENNTHINLVVIGENVAKIGKKAFYGCTNLEYVTMYPKNLKKSVVGKEAFKGINEYCRFYVPKEQLSHYQYIVQQRAGAPLTTKFKAID